MTKRLSYTMSFALGRCAAKWAAIPFGIVGWPTVQALKDRSLVETRLTGRYPRYSKWQWRRTKQ